MSNYTPITDFSAKDALITGNPLKKIKGADFDPEFDAIQTAVATKVDTVGDGVSLSTTTVALELDGLTSETTVDGDADVVGIYDNSAAAHRKVSPKNLVDAGLQEFDEIETDDLDNDDTYVVLQDGVAKLIRREHQGLGLNGQATAYAVQESDGNSMIINTAGSAQTFTLPSGTGLPPGWQVWISSSSGYGVLLGQGSGNTLSSTVRSSGNHNVVANGTAHIVYISASNFKVYGDIT